MHTLLTSATLEAHESNNLLQQGKTYSINGNNIFVSIVDPEVIVLENNDLHQQLNTTLQLGDDYIDSIVVIQHMGEHRYAYYLYENGIGFTEMCGNGCVAALQHIQQEISSEIDRATFISKLGHQVEVQETEQKETYNVRFQNVLTGDTALTYLHDIKEYAFIDSSLALLQSQIKEKINGGDPFHAIIDYRYKHPAEIHSFMRRLGVQNPITYQVIISNIIQVFSNNTTIQNALRSISIENIAIVGGEPHMIIEIPHIEHLETREIFLKGLSFLLRFCPVHTPVVDVSNPNSFFFPNQINIMFLEQNTQGGKAQLYSGERIFNGYNLGLTGACGTGSVAIANHIMQKEGTTEVVVINTSGAEYEITQDENASLLLIRGTDAHTSHQKSETPDNIDEHLLERLNIDIREAKIYDRTKLHNIERKGTADDTIHTWYQSLPHPLPDLYAELGNLVEDTGIHETEITPQEPYKLIALAGDILLQKRGKNVKTGYLDSEGMPKNIPLNPTIGFMQVRKKAVDTLVALDEETKKYETMFQSIFGNQEKVYSSGHIHRWTQAFLANLEDVLRRETLSDQACKAKLRAMSQETLRVIGVEIEKYIENNKQMLPIYELVDTYISSLDEKNNVDEGFLKSMLIEQYKRKLKKMYLAYIKSITEHEFSEILTGDNIQEQMLTRVSSLRSLDENTLLRKTLQRYQDAFLSEFVRHTQDFSLYKHHFEDQGIYRNDTFIIPLSSENGVLEAYQKCIEILKNHELGRKFLKNSINKNILEKNRKPVKVADIISKNKNNRVALMAHLENEDVTFVIDYGAKEGGQIPIEEDIVLEILTGSTYEHQGDTIRFAQFSSILPIAILRLSGGLMEGSERHCFKTSLQAIEEFVDQLPLSEGEKKAFVELSTINRITTDNGDNLAFSSEGYGHCLDAIRKPVQGTNFAGPLEDIRFTSHTATAFSLKELFDHPFDMPIVDNTNKITNVLLHKLELPSSRSRLSQLKAALTPPAREVASPSPEIDIKTQIGFMREVMSYIYITAMSKPGKHMGLIKKMLILVEEGLRGLSRSGENENELHTEKNNTPEDDLQFFSQLLVHSSRTGRLHARLAPSENKEKSNYFATINTAKASLLKLMDEQTEVIERRIAESIQTGIATQIDNEGIADEEKAFYLYLSLIEYVVGVLKADIKEFSGESTLDACVIAVIEKFTTLKMKRQTHGYGDVIGNAYNEKNVTRKSELSQEHSAMIEVIEALEKGYETNTLRSVTEAFLATNGSARTRKHFYEVMRKI